ncbi:MAG: PAS domain S-box protein [Pseudomonadota bacterium]
MKRRPAARAGRDPSARDQIAALRARVAEADELLGAFQRGDVDAVVRPGTAGLQIFTLKGADQAYREMVETMSEGAVTLSPEGMVLYCNQRFADLVGHKLEQVIGAPLGRFSAAADGAAIVALLQRAQAGPARESLTLQRADGARVPVYLALRSLAERGVPAIVGVVTDLSELRRAEAAREREHARLRTFIDANIVGVIIVAADGAILEANDYYLRLVGCNREELLQGRVDWRALTPAQWLPADENTLRELRESGRCAPYEKEYQRRDGSRVWVYLADAVLPDSSGEIAAFAVDITDRKHGEAALRDLNATLERRVAQRTAELEAANKELEGFAYSVSHDLRAPLRAVDSFSKIVVDDYADKLGAEGQRLLGTIRRNAQTMGRLIDDILAFSRAGRGELSRVEVDVAALAREVFAELLPAAGQRRIELCVGALPPAQADRAMLRQVLVNLLSNAIKFTTPRDAARIELSGAGDGDGVEYAVRDNGVGFDPAYAHKLFGVFQRLHTADEFPGTGIGLAIVKRIIDKHGGRVWAESQPGHGATFHFALPLAAAPPVTEPA